VVTLIATFRMAGNLFDPFEVSSVEIRDPAGLLIETIAAGSITHTGLGTYEVAYSVPGDADDGLWSDTWTYVAESGDSPATATLHFAVTVGAATGLPGDPWFTLDDYREKLHEDTVATDAEVEKAALIAQDLIGIITGKTFVATAETFLLDGTGKPQLFMPHNKRIQEITSIKSLDLDDTETDIDISTLAVKRRFVVFRDYFKGDTACAEQEPCSTTWNGTFPRGRNNIKVTGLFGDYLTPPPGIELAAKLLVSRLIEQEFGIVAYSTEGVAGDFSATMKDVFTSATTKGSTGWGDCDSLLATYRSRRPAITMV
jgi:hypothetical protein